MQITCQLSEHVNCIICGNEVDDPDVQLCNTEDCTSTFRDIFLQACH